MQANQNHAILAKADATKLSCPDAPAEPSAGGHSTVLSMKLWHRTVWSPVIVLVAALSIDISSAQTSLINGANQTGTIFTNTTADSYTFTANKGDNIVLRLGTTGFAGNLNLYGPNGALLKTATSGTDTELDYTATNTGTFTALVYSYFADGTGTYVLHLAEFPEAFIVPAGDEGGPMAGVAQYYGTITLGDLDIWAFTACTGDSISLRLNPTNFTGNLNLYGPNGALLNTAASATAAEINYITTNCGTFTVLVSSDSLGGTGTYGLTANGLSDELRVWARASLPVAT